MSWIGRSAVTLGSALGLATAAFEKARSNPQAHPEWLGAWAQSERWKGGLWGGQWSGQGTDWSAQMRALTNSWLFMALDLIAREVSSARFQVTRQMGVDDEPERVVNHPLEQLLRRPNPYMGSAFLWQFSTTWFLLDGNFYWYIGGDETGEPKEIWPLPSSQVMVWPGDNESGNWVDHYKYFVNGLEYRIPARYVLHVMKPNPFDIFRGMSPLTAAMLPVDADLAMAHWNGAFFGQDNVMPSAIINLSSGDPNRPINPNDAERLKTDLRGDYTAAARKTAITTANAVNAVLLGWNAKEMDFIAGRQFSKEEIWDIYGVPAGLMDKNATEANSTVAERTLKNNVWGILTLFSEQMTVELAQPFYGDEFQAGFKDIRISYRALELQEDMQAKATLTLNERRARFWKAEPLPGTRGEQTELEAYGEQQAIARGNETPGVVEIPGVEVAPPEIATPPAALAPKAGDNAKPATVETDNSPAPSAKQASVPDDTLASRRAELRAWRDKALKAVKEGKDAYQVKFHSDTLTQADVFSVLKGLRTADTPEAVKALFGDALEVLETAAPEVAAAETFFRDGGEGAPTRWSEYG